jgi:putative membrane protein
VPFIVRLLINAAALWVATRVSGGISHTGGVGSLLAVALVFGIVNAFIRPLIKVLTIPVILLTLGLFTFVINGLMLWLTSALSGSLGLGFHVAGFWSAVVGALVVSLVSAILSIFVSADNA